MLFRGMRSNVGYYTADMRLLHRLVNIAAMLKLAAEKHPLESREMDELFCKVGAILAVLAVICGRLGSRA